MIFYAAFWVLTPEVGVGYPNKFPGAYGGVEPRSSIPN